MLCRIGANGRRRIVGSVIMIETGKNTNKVYVPKSLGGRSFMYYVKKIYKKYLKNSRVDLKEDEKEWGKGM